MTPRKPFRIRPSGRQRIARRMIIAAGISAFTIAVCTVLYLEFSQTESSKAEESKILTPGMLPVEMNIDEAVIAPADTNIRDGAQYKIARPLSETPAFDE